MPLPVAMVHKDDPPVTGYPCTESSPSAIAYTLGTQVLTPPPLAAASLPPCLPPAVPFSPFCALS